MNGATYLVRAWIPDRPGALGQVASRIGAVRGDVVAIEILERGGGRAVDEIVVELPDANLLDMLIREINEVDGVDVENVRLLVGGHVDPGLDALDAAAQLVGAASADELFEALVDHLHRGLSGGWVAVVALEGTELRSGRGDIPAAAWLAAFLEGSRHAARLAAATGPRDIAWAPLAAAKVALIVGRDGTEMSTKQRHQVAALARIADAWLGALASLSECSARLAHPSAQPSRRPLLEQVPSLPGQVLGPVLPMPGNARGLDATSGTVDQRGGGPGRG